MSSEAATIAAYTMTDTKEEKLAAVDYGLGDLHDDLALLRQIDWRILPTMFLTYLLQFLDKVALNVCAPWWSRRDTSC